MVVRFMRQGAQEGTNLGVWKCPAKDIHRPGYIYSFSEHFQVISLKLISVSLLQYLFSLCDYSFNILGMKCVFLTLEFQCYKVSLVTNKRNINEQRNE